MKYEDIKRVLEGQKDILTEAYEENAKYFKRLPCVSCGSEVMPLVNARKPFKNGQILPNLLAKCKVCGVEFDPYTKIQVNLPRSE